MSTAHTHTEKVVQTFVVTQKIKCCARSPHPPPPQFYSLFYCFTLEFISHMNKPRSHYNPIFEIVNHLTSLCSTCVL